METLKTKIDSPAAVLLTNIVLAVLIFFILMSDWILSIGLMILFIAGALILDQNGIINLIFDAYNHYKHIAILSGIVLVIMLPFSLTGNNYISHIATVAVCYAIACLGLNFQMGSTDMTNFAPAAFMGLGAYSVAVCTTKFGLSPWTGMILGILITGVFGYLIGLPTLKTKGYYLSLVTMAIQIAFTQLINTIDYLGGSDGISGVTKYSIFGFKLYKKYTVFGVKLAPQIPFLVVCIFFLIICAYIAIRVYHSKQGLALNAIAQDEIAANCLGINIANQKLFAFVIGSIFCGLAGSLLVGLEGYVGPDSYDFSKSLMLICMVILGGMDNSIGIIVGAFIFTIISEKLRDFADYQQLVYSLVLVIMLIIRPNGIIPRRVRKYFNAFRSSPVAKTIKAEKAQAIDFNK